MNDAIIAVQNNEMLTGQRSLELSTEDGFLQPHEMPPLSLPNDAPPFITEAWLQQGIQVVNHWFVASDGSTRVPPMALVRCSRGGKTRALLEIGIRFKHEHGDCCVIFISFNDRTEISQWEQNAPINALCIRIAFAVRDPKGRYGNMDFEQFREAFFVTKESVKRWLGSQTTPCLLLVDELNKLDVLRKKNNDVTAAKEVASFLKRHFLREQNRYFVFSSHILSLTDKLAISMSSPSDRPVIVHTLPTTGLKDAVKAFNFDRLSPMEALYCGLAPALIYCVGRNEVSFALRNQVISGYDQRLTDEVVQKLLLSFISGDIYDVPEELWVFMSAVQRNANDKAAAIQWIPFHMEPILQGFSTSSNISAMYKHMLRSIADNFISFKGSDKNSGKAWEYLFVIVLLIRIVTQKLILRTTGNKTLELLSLRNEPSDYTVSFNKYCGNGNFDECKDLNELKKVLQKPPEKSLPHICVYHPRHSSFEMYDAVVAVHESSSELRFFGYQMKQGKHVPNDKSNASVTTRFVFKGTPPKSSDGKKPKGWVVLSEEQIDEFLGVSGMCWAPRVWNKLNEEWKEALEEEEERKRSGGARARGRGGRNVEVSNLRMLLPSAERSVGVRKKKKI